MMDPELVAMDKAHIELIAAVAAALKPKRVLEMGYGSGRTTQAMIMANALYELGLHYTLVDNWTDWNGVMPAEVVALTMTKNMVFNVCTSTEEQFVGELSKKGEAFDLIVSDADHHRSHFWFSVVLERLLAPGGVAFFHDVCSPDFKSLWNLPIYARNWGMDIRVFSASSLKEERCERGLLMVMKRFEFKP